MNEKSIRLTKSVLYSLNYSCGVGEVVMQSEVKSSPYVPPLCVQYRSEALISVKLIDNMQDDFSGEW